LHFLLRLNPMAAASASDPPLAALPRGRKKGEQCGLCNSGINEVDPVDATQLMRWRLKEP
jgi:hypothetical protein